MVLDFLNSDGGMESLNDTFLVLTPKVKKPKQVIEYHPISQCNVRYKLISKPLTNQLIRVFPELIDKAHNAFITNQLLAHNVVLGI